MRAFGLPGQYVSEFPPHRNFLAPVRKEEPHVNPIVRFGTEVIDLKVSESTLVNPTPLKDLESVVDEIHPSLMNGTKDSLTRGGCQFVADYYSLRRNPRLSLKSYGVCLFVFADVSGSLSGDRNIWIIVNGKGLIGKVTLWRHPCQLPWDICTFTAVTPPDGVALPLNGIVPGITNKYPNL